MHELRCTTRDYAWGSRTLIPRFLGIEPDGHPHAELWIGAHPGAPSHLPDGRSLIDLISSEPTRSLGARVGERFGPQLPYLVKALAAAQPLSLQVHPTSSRARAGYAREDAAGIPVDGSSRNYRDVSHKPELIMAITRFEGMAGFRDVAKTAEILGMLDSPWAGKTAEILTDGFAFQALRATVADILRMPDDQLHEVLADIGRASRSAEERSHRVRRASTRLTVDRGSVEREATRVFALTTALAEDYPHDPGVLVALLLNHVVLAPGEAMFLDAGVVHAYTSGFGVEIMASSDNVVRAGLTPKHVDVDELLHIADFTPIPPPIWQPRKIRPDLLCFEPPVDDFALYVGSTPIEGLADEGPRVVFCLDGAVSLRTEHEEITARRGDAIFVANAEGPLRIDGDGRVAIAVVPT